MKNLTELTFMEALAIAGADRGIKATGQKVWSRYEFDPSMGTIVLKGARGAILRTDDGKVWWPKWDTQIKNVWEVAAIKESVPEEELMDFWGASREAAGTGRWIEYNGYRCFVMPDGSLQDVRGISKGSWEPSVEQRKEKAWSVEPEKLEMRLITGNFELRLGVSDLWIKRVGNSASSGINLSDDRTSEDIRCELGRIFDAEQEDA